MLQENGTIASQLDITQEITADSLQDATERRRYSRRKARWTTTITTRDKIVVQCRTFDVSEKGASIESPADFRENAVVIVEIVSVYKGVKKTFRILADVKHSAIAKNGFTLGLFFKDASSGTFEFFRKYSEREI